MMNDTKFITDLLSDFGILPRKLVISLLHKDNPEISERLIRKLRNENRVVPVNDIYIAANRCCKPDARKTTALWVASKFQEDGGITGLFPCRLPSVVTFIRNNEAYEVIVINDGEDFLLAGADVDKDVKYIIVVPDPTAADKLKHISRFADAKYILATVRYETMDEEPRIVFYRKEQKP